MSLEFFLTSLIVILIPGTGVVYVVATGLARGRVASLWAALGCTAGIVPHIAASSLGVAAILHTSALLFSFVKYLGVAYLLYLAWQSWNDQGPVQFTRGEGDVSHPGAILTTGFLINILNPKLSIFFLAFLPQFLDPTSAASVVTTTLSLGAIFMAMTFVVFLVYGIFAAAVGATILARPRIVRWMRQTVAAAFAGFGLRLAFSER